MSRGASMSEAPMQGRCGWMCQKRPARPQQPEVYLEPKWLRCLQRVDIYGSNSTRALLAQRPSEGDQDGKVSFRKERAGKGGLAGVGQKQKFHLTKKIFK